MPMMRRKSSGSKSHSRRRTDSHTSTTSIGSTSLGGGHDRHSLSGVNPTDPKLWETHSVKQVAVIEQQARQKASRKRQELRQLVGESYRDLIASADSILEMNQMSKNVQLSLSSLKSKFDALPSTGRGLENVKLEIASKESVRTTAQRLIKQIVDCPEKLWRCIDNNTYTDGANLYLGARKVHFELVNSSNPVHEHIVEMNLLPFLELHWSCVACFPARLITSCKKRLCTPGLDATDYCDALCALTLLDNRASLSLEDLLEEFLSSKKMWIKRVIYAVTRSMKMHPDVSPQRVILHSVPCIGKTLHDTLIIVHRLFSISSKNEPSMIRASLSAKHELSGARVRSKCSSWLRRCKKEICPMLERVLSKISDAHEMSVIRNTILQSVDSGTPSSESHSTWANACSFALEQSLAHLDLWEFMFHAPCSRQWEHSVREVFAQFVDTFSGVLFDFIKSNSGRGGGSSVDTGSGSTSSANRRHSLGYAAAHLVTDIDGICNQFTKLTHQIRILLKHLLCVDTKATVPEYLQGYLDSELKDVVNSECLDAFAKLSKRIEDYLCGIESTIRERPSNDLEYPLIDQAVFIARTCSKLVKNLDFGELMSEKTMVYVSKSLRSCAHLGYSLWTLYASRTLSERFRIGFTQHLQQLSDSEEGCDAIAMNEACWKPKYFPLYEIEDMHFPTHASHYVLSFLFVFSKEVQKVIECDTHADHGKVVTLMISSIRKQLLELMSDALSPSVLSSISEVGCLQLFFDAKFLMDMISRPEDSSSHSALLARICSPEYIDPINWSLLKTPLLKSIGVLYQRYSVTFGFLVDLAPQYKKMSHIQLREASPQAANILPLATRSRSCEQLAVGAYPRRNRAPSTEKIPSPDTVGSEIRSLADIRYSSRVEHKSESAFNIGSILENVESITGGWSIRSVFGTGQSKQ
eukprot:176120_1